MSYLCNQTTNRYTTCFLTNSNVFSIDKVPLQTWPWTATSDEMDKKKSNGSDDGTAAVNETPSSDSYVPPPLTEGAVSKAGTVATSVKVHSFLLWRSCVSGLDI